MDTLLKSAIDVAVSLQNGGGDEVSREDLARFLVAVASDHERVSGALADKIRWITYVPPDKVKPVEITVEPEKVKGKAGTLEIDLDGIGRGAIRIDGQIVDMVYGLRIESRVGKALSVTIDKYVVKKDENGKPDAGIPTVPADLQSVEKAPGWEPG